jgi:hypothetical protein
LPDQVSWHLLQQLKVVVECFKVRLSQIQRHVGCFKLFLRKSPGFSW